MIKSIRELHDRVKGLTTKKKLVLCSAGDEHSLEAVIGARQKNMIIPVLVGDKNRIKSVSDRLKLDLSGVEIIHEDKISNMVKASVSYISAGEADILMKGHLETSQILKGVLNRDWGLKGSNPVLSHMAMFEIPMYHKLLAITDAAMNISPNLQEKIAIINNAVEFIVKLGIKNPKVAALGAVEMVNEKMQATLDAALLSIMQKRGQIKNCIIDGPLAFDNAISKESKKNKGISGDVAGDADILLAPDIEAGNIMYKAFVFFTKAKLASVVLGAKVPIVLTSRADSEDTKFNSIVLAASVNND